MAQAITPLSDVWQLSNGTTAVIRPVTAADGPAIQALVRGLSPTSRYLRFFNGVQELSDAWLARFSIAAPRADVTLLATVRSAESDTAVAMAQYAADPYPERCEFALVVSDAWQGMGIGRRLLRNLECLARAAGIGRIEGETIAHNESMLGLARAMGYEVRRHPEGALYLKVTRALDSPQRGCSPVVQLADIERSKHAAGSHLVTQG